MRKVKTRLAVAFLALLPFAAHAQLVGGVDTAPQGGLAIGYATNEANGGIAIGSQHTGAGYTSIPSWASFSTVVGTGANTTGQYSSLFGYGAASTNMYGAGFGAGSYVGANYGTALGSQTQVTGEWSVAVGAGSRTADANVVSFGSGLPWMPGMAPTTRRLVNISDGINDSDAATMGQLNAVDARVTTLSNTVAGLSGGTVDAVARAGVTNIVNGTTDLSSATVNGETLASIAARAGTGGAGIDATARAAAATAQSTADTAQITANTALATAGTAIATAIDAKSTADNAMNHSQETRAMFDDFASKTDQRFTAMDHRMDSMTKEYRAGIAAAMASTHAVISAAQAGGIGVGISTFNGQAALSMGLVRQVGTVSVNASLSHSNGQTGAGVGFGWKL